MSRRHESAALAEARERAALLRRLLRSSDPSKAEASAERLRALREFANLPTAEILERRDSVTLRQAQTVIAIEAGHARWEDLRTALMKAQLSPERPLLITSPVQRGPYTPSDRLLAAMEELTRTVPSRISDLRSVTKFRPEVAEEADRFYRLLDSARVSVILDMVRELRQRSDDVVMAGFDDEDRTQAEIEAGTVLAEDENDYRFRLGIARYMPGVVAPAGIRLFLETVFHDVGGQGVAMGKAMSYLRDMDDAQLRAWCAPGRPNWLPADLLEPVDRVAMKAAIGALIGAFSSKAAIPDVLNLPPADEADAVRLRLANADFDFSVVSSTRYMMIGAPGERSPVRLAELFQHDGDVIVGYVPRPSEAGGEVEYVRLSDLGETGAVVWLLAGAVQRQARREQKLVWRNERPVRPETYRLTEEVTGVVRANVFHDPEKGWRVTYTAPPTTISPTRCAYLCEGGFNSRLLRDEAAWESAVRLIRERDPEGLNATIFTPTEALEHKLAKPMEQRCRSSTSEAAATPDVDASAMKELVELLSRICNVRADAITRRLTVYGDLVPHLAWKDAAPRIRDAFRKVFGQSIAHVLFQNTTVGRLADVAAAARAAIPVPPTDGLRVRLEFESGHNGEQDVASAEPRLREVLQPTYLAFRGPYVIDLVLGGIPPKEAKAAVNRALAEGTTLTTLPEVLVGH